MSYANADGTTPEATQFIAQNSSWRLATAMNHKLPR
jgi:hypothetical protein